MRQSTPLLQLQTLQTRLFLSVREILGIPLMGGHMTMACLSGKGHGKKGSWILGSQHFAGMHGISPIIQEPEAQETRIAVQVQDMQPADYPLALVPTQPLGPPLHALQSVRANRRPRNQAKTVAAQPSSLALSDGLLRVSRGRVCSCGCWC